MSAPVEQYKQFTKMLSNPLKGHNGGNPNAKLWFVGVDSGSGSLDMEHNKRLLSEPDYVYMPNQELTGFNLAVKTILRELDLIPDVQTADEMYQSANFYCANIFPLALNRRSNTLEDDICTLTGLPSVRSYEHAALLKYDTAQWWNIANNAKVVVCFSKTYWYNCVYMFSEYREYLDILEQQYDAAIARGDKVICLHSHNRVFIICEHPKQRINDRLAEIALGIRGCLQSGSQEQPNQSKQTTQNTKE